MSDYLKKVCSKCFVEKESFEYNQCKSSYDGLYSYCRACTKLDYTKRNKANKPPKNKDFVYPPL